MSLTTRTREQQLQDSKNAHRIPDVDGGLSREYQYRGGCMFHINRDCGCARCRGSKQRLDSTPPATAGKEMKK